MLVQFLDMWELLILALPPQEPLQLYQGLSIFGILEILVMLILKNLNTYILLLEGLPQHFK